MTEKAKTNPIKLAVSACLLGEMVRFDGGHKRQSFIADTLAQFVSFVPVCPEVEIGMGVPRESVRLVGSIASPRMVGNKTGEDWTFRMTQFASERAKQLKKYNLSGYIFKKGSPSCGIERVKVYSDTKGVPSSPGEGLFAGAIKKYYPDLPVEDEGRLNDPGIRDNFIVRVFAYRSLQDIELIRFARRNYVEFHTVHKYLMLAHSPKHYKLLGKLVAGIDKLDPNEFKNSYRTLFMEGLRIKTTIKKNVNVLYHIIGYLKKELDSFSKQSLIAVINDYQKGLVPLIVPLTLIKHYIEKHDIDYIKDQVYLNPHPKELMLRNHV